MIVIKAALLVIYHDYFYACVIIAQVPGIVTLYFVSCVSVGHCFWTSGEKHH